MNAIVFNPSKQDLELLAYQKEMRRLYDYRLFMLPTYFSKLYGVPPLGEDVRKILKKWVTQCSKGKEEA